MNKKDLKTIANLFFEAGNLKRQQEGGAPFAGINSDATNIASHVARVCLIAYFLAKLEGADAKQCLAICLFHDFPETRVMDLHKVASRYINTKEAEKQALYDQTKNLPIEMKNEIRSLWLESENRETLEGIVAKDADWLEHAVSAREYVNLGYLGMQRWIDNVRAALETNPAKKLLKIIEKSDLNDWYLGLQKMTYEKLKKKSVKRKMKK